MSIKVTGAVILMLVFLVQALQAQEFKFAFVSDTHVGGPTAAEDLRRTVKDINENPELRFVVITGDITEFGSDDELQLAKQILDSLNKPFHIVPGNHDSNWSESGSNSFKTIFGSETFAFQYNGYLFAGTSSGPNMRMGPGQVPRENIVWLDSVLTHMQDPQMPVVYLNHYPTDSAQNNWYEIINRLKKRNTQLLLCGHGHANVKLQKEEIPTVMGRSNLRAKELEGAYNIVTFAHGQAIFEIRKPVAKTQKEWHSVALINHHFNQQNKTFPRPSFAVNQKYTQVKPIWEYQDQSDIGASTALVKNWVIATNTKGAVYALDKNTGKQKWLYQTKGKIYSTPAVSNGYVVVGSSDKNIYCISAKNGKLIWKVATLKPVVASPVIEKKTVFIGGSDGHFRAINLKNGQIKWDFAEVKDFVVTKPLIYQGNIYFGSWGNDFYALNKATGTLAWKWNNGSSNRMFSPAACYPVATNNRLFIVAPDRYMTVLNAKTGAVIWRKQNKAIRVRESMGLSADKKLVYTKTMDGQVYGFSTTADSMQVSWKSELQLPYEISPSALVEKAGVVYVPSHSGLACAVDRKSGKVLWKHKVSNSLVNVIMPVAKNKVVVSTMDGKIALLQYVPK